MARTSKAENSAQFLKFLSYVCLASALADRTKNFDVRYSARFIQDKYGKQCRDLFVVLFIKWVRGGRNLDGVAYKTMWRLDRGVYDDLQAALAEVEAMEMPTARDMLNILQSYGHTPKERVKFFDKGGCLVSEHVYKGEELKIAKAEKKAIAAQRPIFSELRKQREAFHPGDQK